MTIAQNLFNAKTLRTIASRFMVLLCSLGVVLLNTHYIGIEGQGTASLISFGILLIVSLSNFIGGGAIVFLISRIPDGQTILPSFIWALFSSLLFIVIFQWIPIVPEDLILHTALLGLIQSLFIFLQQIALGREEVVKYNIIVNIQALSTLVALAGIYIFLDEWSVYGFVHALYIAFSLTLVCSIYFQKKDVFKIKISALGTTLKEIFVFGKYAQGGNILHLLNQRLNFVFLENLLVNARASTGLYSLVLYIGEGIWTVSKSLSLIQYARIANSDNDEEHRKLTLHNLKSSLAIVFFSSLILATIPDTFYQKIFDRDIEGLQIAMWFFIPGLIANGASIIYAHYFSGKGLYHHNMWASAIGLLVGTISALLFIPSLGVRGAAQAISLALVAQMFYLYYRFREKSESIK